MSEIVEPSMGDEWDLGDVIQDRVQPTTVVNVYLNEAASYAKAEILAEHGKAKPEQIAEFDKALAEIEEQLQASKYQIHLTAVPSRMREDISSKALAKFPIKPDPLWQRDDQQNALERKKYENSLVWLAQITNVVNPRGQSKKSWDQPSMDKFCEALPTAAQNAIDKAIVDLTKKAEQFTIDSASADF